MRGTTLIALILAVGLAAPSLAAPAAPPEEDPDPDVPAFTESHTDRGYALGGPVHAHLISGDSTQVIVGPLKISTLRGDGTPWSHFDITVDDAVNQNVRVLYSFHDEWNYDDGAFGPREAIEMGTFCTSTALDIPSQAVALELRLNSMRTVDSMDDCMPGTATAGKVVVNPS